MSCCLDACRRGCTDEEGGLPPCQAALEQLFPELRALTPHGEVRPFGLSCILVVVFGMLAFAWCVALVGSRLTVTSGSTTFAVSTEVLDEMYYPEITICSNDANVTIVPLLCTTGAYTGGLAANEANCSGEVVDEVYTAYNDSTTFTCLTYNSVPGAYGAYDRSYIGVRDYYKVAVALVPVGLPSPSISWDGVWVALQPHDDRPLQAVVDEEYASGYDPFDSAPAGSSTLVSLTRGRVTSHTLQADKPFFATFDWDYERPVVFYPFHTEPRLFRQGYGFPPYEPSMTCEVVVTFKALESTEQYEVPVYSGSDLFSQIGGIVVVMLRGGVLVVTTLIVIGLWMKDALQGNGYHYMSDGSDDDAPTEDADDGSRWPLQPH
mmetsp:Transcript_34496/g.97305  ORF Transcript_34496/g.97305 Transcript_34496/m.97305 type:complete len:378 (+) Transcript_34496:54-1187(+)